MTKSTAQSLRALRPVTDGITKTDINKVDPRLLVIKPGFNTRDAFVDDYYEQPHVKAHIEKLANAYITGQHVDPIVVQVIDGEICVRSGHCRTMALRKAIDEGHDIKAIEVVEHRGDEAAQQLLTITTNDGLPITPLAVAVVYDRLIKHGYTLQEVAAKVGKTPERIGQMLDLLNLPIDLKKMIQRDQIAASYAAELVSEHGTEKAVLLAQRALARAMKATENQPKKKPKVTRSKISSLPRLPKKVVSTMHSSFVSISEAIDTAAIKDGEVFIKLDMDQLEQLQSIRNELNKLEEKVDEPPANMDMFDGEETAETESV